MTDADDLLEQDKQRAKQAIKNYRQSDGMGLSAPVIIEGSLWTLAAAAALAFVVVMPWVGPDGIISGETWLLISLVLVALLGSAAFLVRILRNRR